MKRVQHFIPRFILEKFILNDKPFKLVDKRYKKPKNKFPGSAMFKEYFYEHDDLRPNEVEDLLGKRETVYAPIIKKIIDRVSLTIEEHKTLLEFRHTIYYRSNEFCAFHAFKKRRCEGDWVERQDWRFLNGIFSSDNLDDDIKKSQLKAIKAVISREDAVFHMSSLTLLCFVFKTKGKKFIVSDSGSLCWGNEFKGMVVIVISPECAIMFPRLESALEIIKKTGIDKKKSTISYIDIDDNLVNAINKKAVRSSFEYYIDPNL